MKRKYWRRWSLGQMVFVGLLLVVGVVLLSSDRGFLKAAQQGQMPPIQTAGQNQAQYVPGEVIVKFRPGFGPNDLPLIQLPPTAAGNDQYLGQLPATTSAVAIAKVESLVPKLPKATQKSARQLALQSQQDGALRGGAQAPISVEAPAAATQELTPLEAIQQYGLDRVQLVKLSNPNVDLNALIEWWKISPAVENVELNYILKIDPPVGRIINKNMNQLALIPNDPGYLINAPNGICNPNLDSLWPLKPNRTDVEHAWDNVLGQGVVTAVIDSGVGYNHLDIDGNIWINTDEIFSNGIDDDDNGFVDDFRGYDFNNNDFDPIDDNGHGTFVSGVLGAEINNNLGIVGVAPETHIMTVKQTDVEGFSTILNASKSFIYAFLNGARIINYSSGINDIPDSSLTVLRDAILAANSVGTLIVAAAGNENIDVSRVFPARVPEVISVAATGDDDRKTAYSNFGSLVDISVPGGHGNDILSLFYLNNDYSCSNGTSFSTPFVSGAAALLFSACPVATNNQVRQALVDGADNIDALNTTACGGGSCTGLLGSGRLDVKRSLDLLLSRVSCGATNQPPVMSPITDKTTGVGQALSFTVSATDPNNDPLTYTMTALDGTIPSGMTFNTATRQFSWTPTASQAGLSEQMAFTVSDGRLTDTEVVRIGVLAEPNLMARWKFDETSGTATADSSGNNNNGTLVNSPVFSTNIPVTTFTNVRSLQLDGTNDYVNIGTGSSLNITGPITLAAWVKTSATGRATVIGGFNGASPFQGYGLGVGMRGTAGRISYWGGASGGAWVDSNVTVNDNNWHHIAAVVSGTSVTFYKDGVLDSTKTATQPTSWTGRRVLGFNNQTAYYFPGLIDDVRIYNRPLTQAEIRTAAGLSVANQPPVANAGPDQTVTDTDNSGSEVVNLSGAASTDSDGTITTYQWKEGTTVLGAGVNLIPTLAVGVHTITLTVTDNSGATATDTVVVTVNPPSSTGPIAHWKFDETSGTTAIDSSGNGNTGTLVNGPISSTVVPPGAVVGSRSLQFDGTNDYVNVGSGSSLNITGPITMAAWVKTSANTRTLIGGFAATSPFAGYGLGIGATSAITGKISYWSGANGAWVGGNTVVNDNQWHHIAVTVSGNTATFYKDGVADGVRTSAQPNSYAGRHVIAYNNASLYMSGTVDDVRIYNRALSAAEIAAIIGTVNNLPIANAGPDQTVIDTDNNGSQSVNLSGAASTDSDGTITAYQWREGTTVLGTTVNISPTLTVGAHTITLMVTDNSGATATDTVVVTVNPPSTTGPIAHYKFDETSGTIAADSSGNNNNGTLVNGPVFSTSVPVTTFTNVRSLQLDGTNDYVNIGTGSSLNITGPITLAAWVKTSATGARVVVGGYNGVSPYQGYGLAVGVVGAGKISYWSGASGGAWVGSNVTVNDNNWHHIAAVVNGTNVSFYKDGVLDSTKTVTQPTAWTGQHVLGYNNRSGAYFSGLIDDVRIYNRALTATEVRTAAGLSVANQPPIANAGPDQTVIDTDNNGSQSVNLSGAASTDSDGTITAYQWREGTTVLGTTVNISPTLTVGAHTITLMVTDNSGATATDTVVVTVTAPSTGPIAHYKFDETSGTTTADSSGNNNTGTLVNGPVFSTNVPVTTFTNVRSLQLDGTNDYVNIGTGSSLNITGPITLVAWVKTSATGAKVVIGGYNGDSPYQGYGLAVGVVGAGKISYWSGASGGAWVGSNVTVNDNNWHHIAAVVNGTSVSFYKDGVLDSTKTATQPTSWTGRHVLGFNNRTSNYFSGLIDDVRIYNRALTVTEVRTAAGL